MTSKAGYVLTVIVACSLIEMPAFAQDAQGFATSDVQVGYGRTYHEPGISRDVPKSDFTFENTAAKNWWSSYLFVDVLRSWTAADSNAKEIYGEWYPSMSLLAVAGKKPRTALLRDVSLTLGLNTGTRSTGPSPFALLPGATTALNVPGFAFLTVGTFVYIDRGQFQGQPTGCHGTTYQVTPSWSLPFSMLGARLRFDGYADFIGQHAECASQVLSMPQLKLDLSRMWGKPNRIWLSVKAVYWHNKYGIEGLQDKVLLPVVIWVLH